jgi:hypothetical protein
MKRDKGKNYRGEKEFERRIEKRFFPKKEI